MEHAGHWDQVFKLLKYFSIASFIALLVATAALTALHERLAVRNLLDAQQQHHVALTRLSANVFWPQFSSFLRDSSALDDSALKSHPETARLHRAVLQELAGTRTLKIKIYDLAARTVFSTEAKQIGEDKSKNAGYLSARAGQPATELTHRNQFSAFEQTVENVDVVSSYVPIYGNDPRTVEAVFEIYSDVSFLLQKLRETRNTLIFQVSAVLVGLYLVLFFIVRHADAVIKRQHLQRLMDEKSLRDARDEVIHSEQFHRSLIEHSSDAVLILDDNFKVRQVTGPLQKVVGIAEAEILGVSLMDRVADAQREAVADWLANVVAQPGAPRSLEFAQTDDAGGTRHLESVATNRLDDPAIKGIVVNVRDVSVRKRAEMEIRRLALHDGLTGLANGELFKQQLLSEIARIKRRGGSAAVLFIDLDRFKRVNDTLGHGAGDALLKEIAQRVRQSLREGDVVGRDSKVEFGNTAARLGGDEFTILLPGIERPEDAALVARRLLEAIINPVELSGQEVIVTASVGIAICPHDGESVEALLKHADAAMYYAKKQGKNNYQFFSDVLNNSVSRSLSMEFALRRALAADEFVLHYQPIVETSSLRIVGCEALIRWNSPAQGMVSPGQFIPLAEECGLIVPIGEYVLRAACAQAAAWRHAGFDIFVNVNLASPSFRQPDLVAHVQREIARHGLPAHALGIEVTESILMEHVDSNVEILKQLKESSVKLAVDDFGTGHSSLSYLSRFPLDTLKIDRSFVAKVEARGDDAKITLAIIALAQSLQLGIVAEGVETEGQRAFLLQAGGGHMQGFLFSRPLPAEEMTSLLRRNIGHRAA